MASYVGRLRDCGGCKWHCPRGLLVRSISTSSNRPINAEPAVEVFLSSSGKKVFSRVKSHPGWLAAQRIMRTRSQCRDLPLPALMWRLRHHVCTEPRGRVYSLLGICRSEDLLIIQPDYSLTAGQVYSGMSRLITEAYRSLDIFSGRSSYHGNSSGGDIPSWVPFLQGTEARQPLVLGIFDWPLPPVIYTACGREGIPIFGGSQQGSALVLRGKLFDAVNPIERLLDFDEDASESST